jgi:hypothetical protein
MAATLKAIQKDNGIWTPSLLDSEHIPQDETSGTAFYTYGVAWGINNRLLDRATYEGVVRKGWTALCQRQKENGRLINIQPVGSHPVGFDPNSTVIYGMGAFISAGSEVYKMVGGKVPAGKMPTKNTITTFMKDGGWCWYQDPRAIIHNGILFMGSVKGCDTGPALVGIYDLKEKKPLGTVLMQDNFGHDDHNSPVFHVRPDGSVLATYAKHNCEKFHYSRISDPSNPLKWSEEFKHERTSPNPKDWVTYMNLYEMKKEGLLYNFYRGINFNPTFVTSTDHGKTWSEPVHFFKNEIRGRHRPYARYTGNGEDTVYVSITDGHPREYGNSIYYFEFRDGKFYTADGTLIKELKDGPLLPSEAELVFKGSGTYIKPAGCESIPSNAWTSSIVIDADGYPHIGYTLYLNNNDHRYRIASWNGKRWIDREVAFAGKCLHTKESSYTGLITLDPADPSSVYISSDVDPATGRDFGDKHEIYTAKRGLKDSIKTIQWKAITRNSKHRNIRPVVVSGSGYKVLLWLSGPWNTFVDYNSEVVGIVLEKP